MQMADGEVPRFGAQVRGRPVISASVTAVMFDSHLIGDLPRQKRVAFFAMRAGTSNEINQLV